MIVRASATLGAIAFSIFSSAIDIPVAQSLTSEDAAALAQAAADSYYTEDGLETTAAAFEEALAAYDALGEQRNSLQTLEWLVRLHIYACDLEQAAVWAHEKLDRRVSNGSDAYPRSSLLTSDIVSDTRQLGELLVLTNQTDRLAAAYRLGENLLLALQRNIPDVDGSPLADSELRSDYLWQAYAELVASHLSFLPADSAAAPALGQRLLYLHQQSAAVTQVDGLLNSAYQVNQTNLQADLRTTALQLSRQYEYEYGQLRALIALSDQFIKMGDYPQSIAYAQQALVLTQQMPQSDRAQTLASYLLAQNEQIAGNVDSAIQNYTTVLVFLDAEETNRTTIWDITLAKDEVVTNLITLHRQLGQTQMANQLESGYQPDTFLGLYATSRSPRVYTPSSVPAFPLLATDLTAQTCTEPLEIPVTPPSTFRVGP